MGSQEVSKPSGLAIIAGLRVRGDSWLGVAAIMDDEDPRWRMLEMEFGGREDIEEWMTSARHGCHEAGVPAMEKIEDVQHTGLWQLLADLRSEIAQIVLPPSH